MRAHFCSFSSFLLFQVGSPPTVPPLLFCGVELELQLELELELGDGA